MMNSANASAATSDERIAHVIYQSVMLPVSLYQDGACVLSYPAPVPSAARLLAGEDPIGSIQVSFRQPRIPQYVVSRYDERFLYFELGEGRALLVGPFLAAPMASGDVYQLVRRLELPVSTHRQLMAYFETLPTADDSRHFYIGQLLQLLFGRRPGGREVLPAPKDHIGYELFQRTYHNHADLFHHPPFFLEELMLASITAGDRRTAQRTMDEINTLKRATLAQTPMRSLKNSLICSCTLFTRAAIAGGAPSQKAFTLSDAYIQNLENETDMGALARTEEQMLLSFVEIVETHRQEKYSMVTLAAIGYIDVHLAEKMQMRDIAKAIYVHPSYLSQRFHKDTGITLSLFIQRRRVEEAKHFLLHTDSPVSEIAHFYQFCSQSHFIQVFKKHTGQTPQAFRKELVY